MKEVRWIIQNNLISENDLNELQTILTEEGIPYHETIVYPFSKDLPDFPVDDKYENIYYGSTTLIDRVKTLLNPNGVFLNDNFNVEQYCNHWGEHALNYGCKIMSIDEFMNSDYDSNKMLFIRPNSDGKEFDGDVREFESTKKMFDRILQYDVNLDKNSLIVVSEPYNILREWRNFVVDGKIVTSSLYRKYFKLNKSATEIPDEMLLFTENMINMWQPAKAFALDICEVEDDGVPTYFVIEAGCINSTGFYASDKRKYVIALTELLSKYQLL